MNDELRVALIQGDTRWHDPAGNREYYGARVLAYAGRAHLIVLPETCTSGFTNATLEQAEDRSGPSMHWLADLARTTGAVVTGSLVIAEGGRYYNRLIWMRPDGSHAQYDKRHLFRMAREQERYAPGRERLVVELHGWRVCPLICYDLRFPVFSRNRHDGSGFDYDLALYVANWPAVRQHAWQTLLRARAIENLCYVVGVNRVGIDGNQLSYAGGSVALDYLGQPRIEFGARSQDAVTALTRDDLIEHRQRFPAHLDADRFALLD